TRGMKTPGVAFLPCSSSSFSRCSPSAALSRPSLNCVGTAFDLSRRTGRASPSATASGTRSPRRSTADARAADRLNAMSDPQQSQVPPYAPNAAQPPQPSYPPQPPTSSAPAPSAQHYYQGGAQQPQPQYAQPQYVQPA